MAKRKQITKKQPITKYINRKSSTRRTAKPLFAANQDLPNYPATDKRVKIAIVQTGSWGDNINSTLMFPPLKKQFPNCIIDVHTSALYASAFYNNPYINYLIKYSAPTKQEALHLTVTIPSAIRNKGYDQIFVPHPMFNPDKWASLEHPELGSNLICAWIRALEEAHIPYELPLETILRLTKHEISRVDRFCKIVNGFDSKHKTILEIHGESGQTFWNDSWTNEVVHKICSKKGLAFISHKVGVPKLASKFENLCFNVDKLSIRECAELFNRCDRFISVSSGLSNACNTNWCKTHIEWLEVVNSPTVSSAPIRSEGKTFWYKNDLSGFLKLL